MDITFARLSCPSPSLTYLRRNALNPHPKWLQYFSLTLASLLTEVLFISTNDLFHGASLYLC